MRRPYVRRALQSCSMSYPLSGAFTCIMFITAVLIMRYSED